MQRIRVTVLAVLLLALIASPAKAGGTDVVCLQVNGRIVDAFLEVIASNDGILVPLVETGRLLGVAVTWQAPEGVAEFTRPSDGAACRLFVTHARLSIGEEAPFPVEPRPVVEGSQPFVPLSVIRAGFGCKADWSYETQAVVIEALRLRDNNAGAIVNQQVPILQSKGGPAPRPIRFTLAVTPSPVGHVWSLGANGSVGWEDGSIGWKLGIGGRAESLQASLQSLGVNYYGPRFELQLGDAMVQLPGLLSGMAVRGLVAGLPGLPGVESGSALTHWSGTVPSGSRVRLFVDGLFFASSVPADGEFEFSGIPVGPLGSTELTLVITHPDGTEETLKRRVTSVPLVQPPGRGQIFTCLGAFPGGSWFDLQDRLMAVDWQQGVSAGLSTRVAFVRTSDETAGELGGTVSNDLLLTGASLVVSDRVSSQIEFMMDRFTDEDVGTGSTLDFGWRWSLTWGLERFGLQATIVQMGPEFRLPKTEVPQNRVGVTVSGRWQPADSGWVTFSYSGQQAADAGWPLSLDHQLSIWGLWTPIPAASLALGTRMWFDPALQSPDNYMLTWSGHYAAGRFSLRGDGGALISSREDGLRAEYFLNSTVAMEVAGGSSTGLSFSYRGDGHLLDDAFGIGANYSWSLVPGHLLTLNLQWQSPNPFYAGPGDPRVRSLTAGTDWVGRIGNKVSGTAGASIVSLFGSEGHEIFPSVKLGLSGRSIAPWDLTVEGTARLSAPSLKVSLRFTGSGLPSPAGLIAVPNAMPTNGGSVGGTVFRDDNGNGRRDAGEPGVRGVGVTLGLRTVITGRNGSFIFGGLQEGRYQLDVSQPTLPIDFSTAAGPWIVEMQDRQNLWQDIPLRFWGVAQGRVFVDRNGDGLFGEGDVPVAGVQIMVDGRPAGTYTDSAGWYYLEGLGIGTHLLSLDPDTLRPGLLGVVGQAACIKENQPETDGCDFVLGATTAFWSSSEEEEE